jgi:hypothetical protein
MARDVSAETQTGRRCIADILITPPGGPPDQLGLGSLTLPGMEERYAGTRSALAATVNSYLRLRLWRIRLGDCAGLGRRVTGVMGPLTPIGARPFLT